MGVDWFNNRDRVIDRIIEKINTQSGSVATPSLKPAFDISAEQIEKKKSAAKNMSDTLLALTRRSTCLMLS